MAGTTATRRPNPLRIVSTSDIHFGHNRVSAHVIATRLKHYLLPRLEDAHILFICGDLWETLLTLCDDSNVIVAFILDLLCTANEYNVTVRVLRGTFSHDRNQSSIFPILHEKYKFANDLKYVDTLSCEYIEHLDLKMLYIPDDLPYASSYDCIEVVDNMLTTMGWSKFDYAIVHGYFEHMLHPGATRRPKCTFVIEQFVDIVARYVLVGHVHDHNVNGQVIYHGSFDRLNHGEEGPKGFIAITDYGDTSKIEFVENKDATLFKTLNLSHITDKDEVTKVYLEDVPKVFPDNQFGFVRVIHPSVEVRQILSRLTATNFPNLNYTHMTSKDSTPAVVHVQQLLDISEYPIPSEDSLPDMIIEFTRCTLSKDRIVTILGQL